MVPLSFVALLRAPSLSFRLAIQGKPWHLILALISCEREHSLLDSITCSASVSARERPSSQMLCRPFCCSACPFHLEFRMLRFLVYSKYIYHLLSDFTNCSHVYKVLDHPPIG